MCSSDLFDVDRKTVYRWRNGVTPVPDYVWPALKIALYKREKDINAMVNEIG